jgi:hypothetical protein
MIQPCFGGIMPVPVIVLAIVRRDLLIVVIWVSVVIGPAARCRRKGKCSQAKGSARNRRGRVPAIIISVVAPAVVVSMAIPTIMPAIVPSTMPAIMPIVMSIVLIRL